MIKLAGYATLTLILGALILSSVYIIQIIKFNDDNDELDYL